jgi:hypothetical protein
MKLVPFVLSFVRVLNRTSAVVMATPAVCRLFDLGLGKWVLLTQFLNGRDIALRCPRRPAKRRTTETVAGNPSRAFASRRSPVRTA